MPVTDERELLDLPSQAYQVLVRDLSRNLDWFRAFLAEHEIQPPKGSAFGDALRALDSVRAVIRGEAQPPIPPDDLVAAGAAALMIGAVQQLARRAPDTLQGVLRIFRGKDILLAREGSRNPARDVSWEVFCAALTAVGGSSQPVLGHHRNPDVLFRIRDMSWGLECKVVYTRNVDTVRNEVSDKLDQIIDGPADRGVVMVDASSVVDHGREGHFTRSIDEAAERLQAEILRFKAEVLSDGRIRAKLARLGPKAVAVVFCAHSAFLAQDSMAILVNLHIVTSVRIDGPDRAWVNRLRLGYARVMLQE